MLFLAPQAARAQGGAGRPVPSATGEVLSLPSVGRTSRTRNSPALVATPYHSTAPLPTTRETAAQLVSWFQRPGRRRQRAGSRHSNGRPGIARARNVERTLLTSAMAVRFLFFTRRCARGNRWHWPRRRRTCPGRPAERLDIERSANHPPRDRAANLTRATARVARLNGLLPTGSYATSTVFTKNVCKTFGPNVVEIATSAASRPRAIKTRPMRGRL